MANTGNQRDDTHGNEEHTLPSMEPRKPQFNTANCSCNCGTRGCVDGESGKDGSEDADSRYGPDFPPGEQGVELQPLNSGARIPSPAIHDTIDGVLASQFVHFRIGYHVLEHENKHAVDEVPLGSVTPLQRVDSTDSMLMHATSSGQMSMASSMCLPRSPRSPRSYEELTSGIGGWIHPGAYGCQDDGEMEDGDDEDSQC